MTYQQQQGPSLGSQFAVTLVATFLAQLAAGAILLAAWGMYTRHQFTSMMGDINKATPTIYGKP